MMLKDVVKVVDALTLKIRINYDDVDYEETVITPRNYSIIHDFENCEAEVSEISTPEEDVIYIEATIHMGE